MDRTTIESRAYTGMPIPEELPHPTTMRLPSMPLTALSGLSGLGQANTTMTPTDLVQRLPSIVNPTPAVATTCDSISTWVDQNNIWALLILGGLAFLAFKD